VQASEAHLEETVKHQHKQKHSDNQQAAPPVVELCRLRGAPLLQGKKLG
jgi:hypothetical protein